MGSVTTTSILISRIRLVSIRASLYQPVEPKDLVLNLTR